MQLCVILCSLRLHMYQSKRITYQKREIFLNLCTDIVDLSKTLSLNYKFTELKYFQVWSKNVIRLFSGLRIYIFM